MFEFLLHVRLIRFLLLINELDPWRYLFNCSIVWCDCSVQRSFFSRKFPSVLTYLNFTYLIFVFNELFFFLYNLIKPHVNQLEAFCTCFSCLCRMLETKSKVILSQYCFPEKSFFYWLPICWVLGTASGT